MIKIYVGTRKAIESLINNDPNLNPQKLYPLNDLGNIFVLEYSVVDYGGDSPSQD